MTAPLPHPSSPEIGACFGPKSRKKASRRAAITAYCKWCLYDPGARGTWRQQVDGCTATDCPLYPVRPRSTGRGPTHA